jgi:uncharacterized phage-associated protein
MIHYKLHKLLYYAFGLHRATTGENLFNEDILAWRLGASIREIYDVYREYGYSDVEDKYWYEFYNLTAKEKETIEIIWEHLGKIPADMLISLNRSETPWIDAWENDIKVIDRNSIEEHFRNNYLIKEGS